MNAAPHQQETQRETPQEPLAAELVIRICDLQRETNNDDRQLVELLVPYLLEAMGKRMPLREVFALIDRERAVLTAVAPVLESRKKNAAKAASESRVPCTRWLNCGRYADREKWDPVNARWLPVCAVHVSGATPMEVRPLEPRP